MFDAEEVRAWLGMLHGDSPGLVHLCGTGRWAGRMFTVDDLDAAVAYAAQLDADGREGVYLRMTTLRQRPAEGRGGADLSCALPGLWADVDIAGPGHEPTRLPLPADEDAARNLVDAAGLPEVSVWVHSGGGLYPLWLLHAPHRIGDDLDQVAALSARWQQAIAAAAVRLGLHYGSGVGDLARVLRIPGTVNRKAGLARPCRLLDGSGRMYALDELAAAVADRPTSTPVPVLVPPAPDRPAAAATPTGGDGPFDALAQHARWADLLEPAGWRLVGHERDGGELWRRPGEPSSPYSARANHKGVPVLVVHSDAAGLPAGPGQRLTMGRVFAALHHGGDETAAARDLLAAAAGTAEASPAAAGLPDTVLAAVRRTHRPAPVPLRRLALVGGTAVAVAEPLPGLDEPPQEDAPEAGPAPMTYTDDGNAVLLVDTVGERVRFVPERGRWLVWAGYRWAFDERGQVTQHARTVARALPTGSAKAVKHRLRSLSYASIEAMIRLARSDPRVVVPAAELDADPYALCTPAGVVDLRTGLVRPPVPAELHTRSTAVPYDPQHPTPRWRAFLADTFGDDLEVAGYVQRLVGDSATGTVAHHVLPFLHGPGRNGKSVFLDVVRRVLGDYAATAPAGFLMAGAQQHETEVARLAGLRFVICSEVNADARFDEAKVKLLTGGDALTARFMRQDFFTFPATHHLWLMGNHQPQVKAGGVSFWRRLRLIGFTRIVDPDKVVENLADLLVAEEGPGILAWIVAGAVAAHDTGLRDPASVLAATGAYAAEEDALARFVDDRCHIGGGAQVRTNTVDVRAAYEAWCHAEGEQPISPQRFGRELRTRYQVEQVRSNGRRFYTGLDLLNPSLDDEPDTDHWSDR